MAGIKVSVIIPVYNAGAYFEKCLNSLINQTLKEIEIILVLNQPTDGSDRLAEAFAARDLRIKLIYNEENLHAGFGRNVGIEVAEGEYIGFHDHDDYCDANMFELLYNHAVENDLEVSRCNFDTFFTTKRGLESEENIYPEVSTQVTDREWVYKKVCSDTISCVIWNHIYKADFLRKHKLQFPDSRKMSSEDSIFFMQVYEKVKRLGTIPHYLYHHMLHESNAGKSYGYRAIRNRILFFETLYTILKEAKIGEEQAKSYLAENIMKKLYTASRQALVVLPLKKAFLEIRIIKQNDFIMSNIRYLFEKKNHKILFRQKPTVIVFFFILKLF